MGGPVSRYYIENCTSLTHYGNNSHESSACLYNDRHVSKLITIDTPHWGSGIANTSCNIAISENLGYHKLCDHDLLTDSAMYGGSFSTVESCGLYPKLGCEAVNYKFTDELSYNRNRQTLYYAIAGIDYNSDVMNDNNYSIELFEQYNTYEEWWKYCNRSFSRQNAAQADCNGENC